MQIPRVSLTDVLASQRSAEEATAMELKDGFDKQTEGMDPNSAEYKTAKASYDANLYNLQLKAEKAANDAMGGAISVLGDAWDSAASKIR
jgi:hypothetical protein